MFPKNSGSYCELFRRLILSCYFAGKSCRQLFPRGGGSGRSGGAARGDSRPVARLRSRVQVGMKRPDAGRRKSQRNIWIIINNCVSLY